MTDCNHARPRCIAVFMQAMPDQPMRAVFAISCEICGTRFQFADGDGAFMFNDSRTELSAWVTEGES